MVVLVFLGLIGNGCGGSDTGGSAGNGDAEAAPRAVDIEMRDISYSIRTLNAVVGEKVRFSFYNTGDLVHEAFVGDAQAQEEHEMEMRDEQSSPTSQSGMDMGSRSGPITVKPRTGGILDYTFDKAGTTFIGCHEPGHYATGMKITVTVA